MVVGVHLGGYSVASVFDGSLLFEGPVHHISTAGCVEGVECV